MEQKSLLEMIQKIIREELRYYGHYLGQVVNIKDPEKIGRVRAIVPQLSWDTESVAPWCSPRQQSGIITPVVGTWIEVYFMDGNRDQPRYHGNATEMEKSLPTKHEGKETNQVLFEDGKTKESILYDQLKKVFVMGEGNEVMVLGNKLQSFLESFTTTYSSHAHPGVTPGPGVTGPSDSPQSAPSDILSQKFKVE